jgi:hypothetical protein
MHQLYFRPHPKETFLPLLQATLLNIPTSHTGYHHKANILNLLQLQPHLHYRCCTLSFTHIHRCGSTLSFTHICRCDCSLRHCIFLPFILCSSRGCCTFSTIPWRWMTITRQCIGDSRGCSMFSIIPWRWKTTTWQCGGDTTDFLLMRRRPMKRS